MFNKQVTVYLLMTAAVIGTNACTPTVNVKSEPIEINMNVKIEHEVRIKVDKELEQAFENEDLF